MEIRAGFDYPFGYISNLIRYKFVFREVNCYSMEGLLQSFKFKDPTCQKGMCRLSGVGAKHAGYHEDWWTEQTLWWNGIPMGRQSQEYQDTLDEAYNCLFRQNAKAQKALLDTGHSPLKHSMGKSDPTRTILTKDEFCSRLLRIRSELQAERFLEFDDEIHNE